MVEVIVRSPTKEIFTPLVDFNLGHFYTAWVRKKTLYIFTRDTNILVLITESEFLSCGKNILYYTFTGSIYIIYYLPPLIYPGGKLIP